MSTASAASSASTLIVLQIGARVFTFVFNQILVRIVSPTIFGLANIQLELLLSTILFLSREAIRDVLLRSKPGATLANNKSPRAGVTNTVHNISLLPIPIGLVLTFLTCGAYVAYLSPEEIRSVSTFYISVLLYAAGALSELLYEPLHIRALALGQPSLRVKAEGAAVFSKCIVTICAISVLPRVSKDWARLMIQDERSSALLGFGLGQLAYGVSMLSVHLAFFLSRYSMSQTLDLFVAHPDLGQSPSSKNMVLDRWLDRPTLSLCAEMFKQSLLKHGLTEADKFAIAKFATLEDQGGYALASNYGSLVARILFQPVEETARLIFSQNLVSLDLSSDDEGDSAARSPALDTSHNGKKDATAKAATVGTSIESKSKKSTLGTAENEESETAKIELAATLDRISGLLSALFRLHFLLAALLLTFGSPLSVPFLHLLAGPRWAYQSSAPVILGAYTAYLPIMGINGLVEGFFQSTASKKLVAQYNRVLFVASMTFAVILAARGRSANTTMVWANAGSLAVRAYFSWNYLIRYFEKATQGSAQSSEIVSRMRLTNALPSRVVIAVFVVVAIALRRWVPHLIPPLDTVLAKSSGNKGRLEAIQLLTPILAIGVTGVLICICTVALFDRRELANALSSIRSSRTSARASFKKSR